MRQIAAHLRVGVDIAFADNGTDAPAGKTSPVVEGAFDESLVALSGTVYIFP